MTDDVFDLDVAAAETRGQPWRMRFGDQIFDMPALSGRAFLAVGQLSADFAVGGDGQARAMGQLGDVLRSLFASDDDWDRFLDAGAEPADFVALLRQITERTGSNLGEAQPPSGSSGGAGMPSKPTSLVSTG